MDCALTYKINFFYPHFGGFALGYSLSIHDDRSVPTMTFSVHLTNVPADDILAYLRECLHPNIKLTCGDIPENADFAILITGRPDHDMLKSSPNLRAVVVPFAGMPDATRDIMREYPEIAVHNLHHNAAPTAEMALTLLLTVAKGTLPVDHKFRNHDWTPRYDNYPGVLLSGKTALILGYGMIGQHLSPILRAIGMNVLGIRRRYADESQGIYLADKLHELLPQANVLIVAVPGTEDTNGLIDEREISLLPKGAIIVNIGRGKVVDQYALYNALKSGHLHGAGQDVWYYYPTDEASRTHTLPADVPFHELDNIVMSPHRGGFGGVAEIEFLRMKALADMLNKAANGEDMPHRVSLELGY
jgi:phosphoglycerate dehydrogenase-like enzyme